MGLSLPPRRTRSRRIQSGGYASADDAHEALQRALTAAQRRKGLVRFTLADLAEEYFAQHDGQPETTAKLRWLLTKSTAAFGSTPLAELDAREIATVSGAARLRRDIAGLREWRADHSDLARTSGAPPSARVLTGLLGC